MTLPAWGALWGAFWGGAGAGSAPPSAYAISERQAWVTLPSAPLALSTIDVGDALNPASWSISRTDTGQDLIVIGVGPTSNPNTFELYALLKFGSFSVQHEVRGSLLDGLTLSPISVDLFFAGCAFRPEAEVPGGMVDVANPYFAQASEQPASALSVGAGGDYANESGIALYRKLIIRRLTTAPGDFFHLAPDEYGVGLRVKETPSVATMPLLRAQVLQQLQREPEFSSVSVRVLLDVSGVLLIQVSVVVALTGQTFSIPIPVSTGILSL